VAAPTFVQSTLARGPHGCLLGVIAVLLICVVTGAFAWLVGRPFVTNAVESEVDRTITTQVAAIATLPVEPNGEIVVTEAQINESIRSYQGSFDPIKDPRVEIAENEVRVRFKLYGSTSTYRGGLEVHNNHLIVVDERVDGPAGRVLDETDLATILEHQVATLLDRFDLEPVAVHVDDGAITIETRPA
jgi:hypothetical protein